MMDTEQVAEYIARLELQNRWLRLALAVASTGLAFSLAAYYLRVCP